MSAPRVVFVADGSRAVGAGHQVRCGAIAQAARELGVDVVMCCREAEGATAPWAWRDLPLEIAPAALSPARLVAWARERVGADLLVIDHYGPSADDVDAIARAGACALIDDAPGRASRALRLVVDPTIGAGPADHAEAPMIGGAAYAPLRGAFVTAAGSPRADELVVVALGASDPLELASRVCRALLRDGARRLQLITADATAGEAVARGLDAPGRVVVRARLGPEAMARCLAGAGAAVVTASTSALEAAAVGTPFVAIEAAGNQRRAAAALRAAGVPVVAPDALDEVPRLIARAPARVLGVDGRGAVRIAERLVEIAACADDGALRGAAWADADALLAWANDPAARGASFRTARITRNEHLVWLRERLLDPDARVYVGRDDGVDAGVVRLQRDGRDAVVSIAVDPVRRGRGVGKRLLDAVARRAGAARFCARLIAWIRPDNAASLAVFRGSGWKDAGSGERDGIAALRLEREVAA